jgi:hypothetical protein
MMTLAAYIIDEAGNIAISSDGLALLDRINDLRIPAFVSTEEATLWGSNLSAEEHDTLIAVQRRLSNAACAEQDPQHTLDLATRAQLVREAAEAFPSRLPAPST